MARARMWWVLAATFAVALGASACGGEDEEPGAAELAVAGVVADQVPTAVTPAQAAAQPEPVSAAQAAAATPPPVASPDQPALPPAAPSALPSPGSLASGNWHPSPPPCRDCPLTPEVQVGGGLVPVAPPGAR